MLETESLVDITIPQDAKLTVCGDIHGTLYADSGNIVLLIISFRGFRCLPAKAIIIV